MTFRFFYHFHEIHLKSTMYRIQIFNLRVQYWIGAGFKSFKYTSCVNTCFLLYYLSFILNITRAAITDLVMLIFVIFSMKFNEYSCIDIDIRDYSFNFMEKNCKNEHHKVGDCCSCNIENK